MNKLQSKIFLVSGLLLVLAFTSILFASKNQQVPETEPAQVAYYLLGEEDSPNVTPFEGCGTEYLQRFDSITQGGLKESLQELFSIKDPLLSSLASSDIEVAIDDNVINLQGQLISAGTCDDPRVINQITKTIELYLPAEGYTIMLNGSESDWRCWNDMSDLCQ